MIDGSGDLVNDIENLSDLEELKYLVYIFIVEKEVIFFMIRPLMKVVHVGSII